MIFKLIREIRSKAGELHFKRWRVIETPWFNIYIHYIAKSDEDEHLHEHPWNFRTFVLKGGYKHRVIRPVADMAHFRNIYHEETETVLPFHSVNMRWMDLHKVELFAPTWSLVFTGPRINDGWCYYVDGKLIHHTEYRRLKNVSKTS